MQQASYTLYEPRAHTFPYHKSREWRFEAKYENSILRSLDALHLHYRGNRT